MKFYDTIKVVKPNGSMNWNKANWTIEEGVLQVWGSYENTKTLLCSYAPRAWLSASIWDGS